jgi:hypothetical protein
MAGILIVTQAEPLYLRDTALGVAQSMGYEIAPLDEWSHSAKQGNLAMSIFFGAFVAYCDFKLRVVFPGDGTSHLILERNVPWWTGVIGNNRVKGRAMDLANGIQNAIGQAGFAILDRRDI